MIPAPASKGPPPWFSVAALVVVVVAGAVLVALGHPEAGAWLSVVVLALVSAVRSDQSASTATAVHDKVNGGLEDRVRGAVVEGVTLALNSRSIVEEPFRPKASPTVAPPPPDAPRKGMKP